MKNLFLFFCLARPAVIFALAVFSITPGFAATQTGPNFVVNSLADTDDGSCDLLGQGTGNKDCTLREAIHAANAYNNNAVVSFNVSGTITLGSTLPNITGACRIDGSGQKIIISGNNSSGIFQITGAATSFSYGAYTVAFNALTMANSSGSAMTVQGTAALVTNCLFADNSAGFGGAIYVGLSSTATVANSTFTNNSANSGGAIYTVSAFQPNNLYVALYVSSSTFYNNHATFGTGQFNLAAADIYSVGASAAELRNTVLVNTHFHGMNQEDNAQGLTYVEPSVIFNIDIDSQSFNATQATAAQINLDTTLKDNGGSTRTLALLPGSVAINAGNNTAATGAPVNNQDQRGYVRVRPGDANCDVGAYEVGASGSLVVTTAADLTAATAGQNSLRTAVAYAESLGGSQTITFAPTLAGQTMTLNTPWSNVNTFESTSALRITSNITIQGLTSSPGVTLAVSQSAQLRHFLVDEGAALRLSNLTLSGGQALTGGVAYGGAIWNFGSLTVSNCTLTGNTAAAEGGAIRSWGGSQLLAIDNSTFTGNTTNGTASAIITGALSNTFRYLTITNNTATNGTGNALVIFQNGVTMVNSIINGNNNDGVGSVNGGAFTAQSTNNILGSGGTAGLTTGVNGNLTGVPVAQLKFDTLANHGGPTPTIALQPGSIAVDAGVAVAGITTDQIGTSRPQGNAPDIGAFELIPVLVPGIYANVNGPGTNGNGSLIGYPGGTTPGFALFRNLNPPGAMVFDAAGNLYYTTYDVSGQWTYLHKLAQGSQTPGIIASYFGRRVTGLALNSTGDALYVVMNGNNPSLSVGVVSPTGAFGSYIAIFTGGASAGGAAMDSADNLYFANTTDQTIRKFPTRGGDTTTFATGVSSARGMAVDAHGNLFVATGNTPGNDSILKFTPAGAQSTFATGLTNAPLGLAFDHNGNLFVAETGAANQSGDIIMITPDGTKTTFDSNLGPALAGGNGGPQYLAIFPGLLPVNESLVVTTTVDERDFTSDPRFGTGTSLREALAYAATLAGPQTITFGPALAGQTVTLASGWTGAADDTALRVNSGTITIAGPAAGVTLAVAGGTARRHLSVATGATLALSNLTLTGGSPSTPGGAALSEGTFSVTNSTFANNAASEGGAIQSTGTLTITNSTFRNNASGFNGGALRFSGTATISGSTFNANTVVNEGGALISFGDLTATNCTFADNGKNALVLWQGTADLRHVTVAYNRDGGLVIASAATTLRNSVVAGNAGLDVLGPLAGGSSDNLLNLSATAAGLGTLAGSGGPTQTIALFAGSPALNAGVSIAGITTDQRGLARGVGRAPDIGAFEDGTGDDDPDRDSLTNLAELPLGTNPLSLDTDGDGFNDATEILNGSNPASNTSFPAATRIERVLGIGPARGLDLTGNFRYAVNIGITGPAGQIGDADFTADNVSGITVTAPNEIANWTAREFGNSPAEDALETVYRSIRWGTWASGVQVDAEQLVPGRNYKLQLLFADSLALDRTFDIRVNGSAIISGFNTNTAQGAAIIPYAASAVVHEFTAPYATLQVDLSGSNAPITADPNPILNGFTLEEIPTQATAPIITPAPGTYTTSIAVTLSTTAQSATIRYTTNGSDPSETNGTIYSGPFTLTTSCTVRAIAVSGGWLPSTISSAGYTVQTPLEAWRAFHGLASNGSQDLANPANDGIANLLKYAFNMAPNAGDLTQPNVSILLPNGSTGLPRIWRNNNGQLTIEFIRRKAVGNPGISYTVLTGDDLNALTPLDPGGATINSVDAVWERVTITDPTLTTRRFGRVMVGTVP